MPFCINRRKRSYLDFFSRSKTVRGKVTTRARLVTRKFTFGFKVIETGTVRTAEQTIKVLRGTQTAAI